jgi:hypothetical protein
LALDWHRIGRLAQDWHWIGQLALDWPIGTGLALIGRLAPVWLIGTELADWHRIGTDWHGLARIGKLANLRQNEKLAPDWPGIGMD